MIKLHSALHRCVCQPQFKNCHCLTRVSFLSPARDLKSLCLRKCGHTWSLQNHPCLFGPQRKAWSEWENLKANTPTSWSPPWMSISSNESPVTPWKWEVTWIPKAMALRHPRGPPWGKYPNLLPSCSLCPPYLSGMKLLHLPQTPMHNVSLQEEIFWNACGPRRSSHLWPSTLRLETDLGASACFDVTHCVSLPRPCFPPHSLSVGCRWTPCFCLVICDTPSLASNSTMNRILQFYGLWQEMVCNVSLKSRNTLPKWKAQLSEPWEILKSTYLLVKKSTQPVYLPRHRLFSKSVLISKEARSILCSHKETLPFFPNS